LLLRGLDESGALRDDVRQLLVLDKASEAVADRLLQERSRLVLEELLRELLRVRDSRLPAVGSPVTDPPQEERARTIVIMSSGRFLTAGTLSGASRPSTSGQPIGAGTVIGDYLRCRGDRRPRGSSSSGNDSLGRRRSIVIHRGAEDS
jgi:hypothetical protein